MKKQNQINIESYHSGGFVGAYQKLIKDTVIPYQYSVLCDKAENVPKSHVLQNFINAGAAVHGGDVGDGFFGMVFQDSDAGKWLEAVAYSLSVMPDPELEQIADDFIDAIASAQEDDGYLNTHFTLCYRDRRWKNLLEGHELYSAGHLMEGACAYYEATGKRKFLDVMHRNVEHIYNHFITEGHEGYPGHPEVELALMKMYRATGDKRCLELCEHFVNIRGVDPDFYKKEVASRDWRIWGNDPNNGLYQQSAQPVRNQKDAVGHAVRAVYLYTAMADLAAETEDKSLMDACKTLWRSIVDRRMYITGGIGSTHVGEAFTTDYDLPNDVAYAETCASVGLVFFASRMLEAELKGEYADVMELALYNTSLAGMQLDGKRFFYVNPLEVVPGIAGRIANHWHVSVTRPGWHVCACCPPNLARLIVSIGKYAYGESSDTAYCHLYAAGDVEFKNGMKLKCETGYPYDFTITYKVERGGKLAIRIPGWSKKTELEINGKAVDFTNANGYTTLDANDGDVIKLVLDDTPRFVYASPKVPNLTGCAALMRGPLTYCFEGIDNDGDVLSLSIVKGSAITVGDYEPDLLSGTVRLAVDAKRTEYPDSLYVTEALKQTDCKAVAVPYYTWCNRGENQMRVWLPLC